MRDTGHPVTFGTAAVRNLIRRRRFPPSTLSDRRNPGSAPSPCQAARGSGGRHRRRSGPTHRGRRPARAESPMHLSRSEFPNWETRSSVSCGNSANGPRLWSRRFGSVSPHASPRNSPTAIPVGPRRRNPSSPTYTVMSSRVVEGGSGREESRARRSAAVRHRCRTDGGAEDRALANLPEHGRPRSA